MTIKENNKIREWATPLTAGAFILSAVTGIMLFFKINPGLVKPAHEWLSWLLVIGALTHVAVNWRTVAHYVSKPVGKVILTLFILLLGVSMLPVAGGKSKGHPVARITDSMVRAPLSVVARTANHTPDEAIAILKSKGIQVEGKDQTVQDIASRNNQNPIRVLDVIF
jgi:hypothetical protein